MHELPITDQQRDKLLTFIVRVDATFGGGTFEQTDDLSDYEILTTALSWRYAPVSSSRGDIDQIERLFPADWKSYYEFHWGPVEERSMVEPPGLVNACMASPGHLKRLSRIRRRALPEVAQAFQQGKISARIADTLLYFARGPSGS